MQIYVHDFHYEDAEVNNMDSDNDFLTSLSIYYNFSPEDPGDGWDGLEMFNVSVGTPMGMAKYLKDGISNGIFKNGSFVNHFLIVQNRDMKEIKHIVKKTLESLKGSSEKELVLKAMRFFGWEWANNDEVFGRFINS